MSYFENVEQLCTILSQHTIDRALAGASDSFDGHGAAAAPGNVFRSLLFEMAETLDARSDLDDDKSLRQNFLSMAAAVRQRLDEKTRELRQLQSDFSTAHQANDEAASALIKEKVEQYEHLVSSLESQLADAQDQLASQQEQSASLTSTADRLHQQHARLEEDFETLQKHCATLEEDIEALRLESHGLQNKVAGKQQELAFQIEENKALHGTIEELTANKGGSVDDHPHTMDMERMRQEWTAAAKQEEAESWHNKEFIVRQALETQIKAVRWENSVWKDLIRGMMARSMSNMPPPPLHQHNSTPLQGPNGNSIEGNMRLVTEAFDDVDHEVERAIERTMLLQDSMLAGPAVNGRGDTSRYHADFLDALNKVLRGLEISISRKWRENVCGCVESVVTASYRALASASGMTGGSVSGGSMRQRRGGHSASSSSGGSSSTGNPLITAEQKALIREKNARMMDELKRKYQQLLEEERAMSQRDVERLKEAAKDDKRMLTNECRYLRGRIQCMASNFTLVLYQKEVLVQLIGGHAGMFERIDELLLANRGSMSPGMGGGEPRKQAARRWRRVMLVLRFRNRLQSLLSDRRRVDEIKTNALRANAATCAEPAGPSQPQYVGYQVNGHRTTPITPSKLRNRGSDLHSSMDSLSFH
ncbi:hypothetical protein EC988_005412 [Linderina pennispora]|nr:hypothetical protein EC988_005412 [Linderina pennispora]